MASHALTPRKRACGGGDTRARATTKKKAREEQERSALPCLVERALERGPLLGSGELNDVYRARWNRSAVALKVVRAQTRRAVAPSSAAEAPLTDSPDTPSASLRRQLRARALQCMVHEVRSLQALEDHGAAW